MTPEQVYAELNQTFIDWDGLLANPRFCRHDGFVSWTGFSGGRLKEPVTMDQVITVVESRQFSFQSAEDGSIFQILYNFDSLGVLQTARLAFYLLRTRGSFEDGTAELSSSAWIRIDYDLPASQGVLHTDCHLHIHGFPNARVAVNGVPGPRQFVELVVSMCYPELYRVHRLDHAGNIQDAGLLNQINACSQLETSSPTARPIIHVALPETPSTTA